MTILAKGYTPYTCAAQKDCTCSGSTGHAPCGALVDGYCNSRCHGLQRQYCTWCPRDVKVQKCYNYVSTCYRNWVTVSYEPQVPSPAATARYNSCVDAGGGSSCRDQLQVVVNASDVPSCTLDELSCAESYLATIDMVGGQLYTEYEVEDTSVVYIFGEPRFRPPVGAVLGILLGAIVFCCAACGMGFRDWKTEDRSEKLWVPQDAGTIYNKLYTRCSPYLFGMLAAAAHQSDAPFVPRGCSSGFRATRTRGYASSSSHPASHFSKQDA
mgnify:CR=1 FL=1